MTIAGVQNSIRITDVGSLAVPVVEQDRAVRFYTDVLGFEVRLDVAMSGGGRWIQVAPPAGTVPIALVAGQAAGIDTGITLVSGDASADHAALGALGVEVDDLLRWPAVPAMFILRDSEGNQLKIMEATSPEAKDDRR